MPQNDTFGPYLRELRKGKGMTLQQVKDETEISMPYLSLLERNAAGCTPSPSMLDKLAPALGVSTREMYEMAGRHFGKKDGKTSLSAKRNVRKHANEIENLTEQNWDDKIREELENALFIRKTMSENEALKVGFDTMRALNPEKIYQTIEYMMFIQDR